MKIEPGEYRTREGKRAAGIRRGEGARNGSVSAQAQAIPGESAGAALYLQGQPQEPEVNRDDRGGKMSRVTREMVLEAIGAAFNCGVTFERGTSWSSAERHPRKNPTVQRLLDAVEASEQPDADRSNDHASGIDAAGDGQRIEPGEFKVGDTVQYQADSEVLQADRDYITIRMPEYLRLKPTDPRLSRPPKKYRARVCIPVNQRPDVPDGKFYATTDALYRSKTEAMQLWGEQFVRLIEDEGEQ